MSLSKKKNGTARDLVREAVVKSHLYSLKSLWSEEAEWHPGPTAMVGNILTDYTTLRILFCVSVFLVAFAGCLLLLFHLCLSVKIGMFTFTENICI